MLTAERNRLQSADSTVRRRLEVHIRWLGRELSEINDDLDGAIQDSPLRLSKGRNKRSRPHPVPLSLRERGTPHYTPVYSCFQSSSAKVNSAGRPPVCKITTVSSFVKLPCLIWSTSAAITVPV